MTTPSAANKPLYRHHIDRRADRLLAGEVDVIEQSDDDLLSTRETAAWLGVSDQWLEIGRGKKYGPPYQKLGPRLIRYLRGDVKRWLKQRTAEFGRRGR
jgi:predicted DNA-binding transcriptional regulator AlpA